MKGNVLSANICRSQVWVSEGEACAGSEFTCVSVLKVKEVKVRGCVRVREEEGEEWEEEKGLEMGKIE